MKFFCRICLDSITEISEISSTQCGHIFHSDCIKKWLKQKRQCPFCLEKAFSAHRIYLPIDPIDEKFQIDRNGEYDQLDEYDKNNQNYQDGQHLVEYGKNGPNYQNGQHDENDQYHQDDQYRQDNQYHQDNQSHQDNQYHNQSGQYYQNSQQYQNNQYQQNDQYQFHDRYQQNFACDKDVDLSQFCQNCYDTKEIEQAIHNKVHDQKDLYDQFGHFLENEHTNRKYVFKELSQVIDSLEKALSNQKIIKLNNNAITNVRDNSYKTSTVPKRGALKNWRKYVDVLDGWPLKETKEDKYLIIDQIEQVIRDLVYKSIQISIKNQENQLHKDIQKKVKEEKMTTNYDVDLKSQSNEPTNNEQKFPIILSDQKNIINDGIQLKLKNQIDLVDPKLQEQKNEMAIVNQKDVLNPKTLIKLETKINLVDQDKDMVDHGIQKNFQGKADFVDPEIVKDLEEQRNRVSLVDYKDLVDQRYPMNANLKTKTDLVDKNNQEIHLVIPDPSLIAQEQNNQETLVDQKDAIDQKLQKTLKDPNDKVDLANLKDKNCTLDHWCSVENDSVANITIERFENERVDLDQSMPKENSLCTSFGSSSQVKNENSFDTSQTEDPIYIPQTVYERIVFFENYFKSKRQKQCSFSRSDCHFGSSGLKLIL